MSKTNQKKKESIWEALLPMFSYILLFSGFLVVNRLWSYAILVTLSSVIPATIGRIKYPNNSYVRFTFGMILVFSFLFAIVLSFFITLAEGCSSVG